MIENIKEFKKKIVQLENNIEKLNGALKDCMEGQGYLYSKSDIENYLWEQNLKHNDEMFILNKKIEFLQTELDKFSEKDINKVYQENHGLKQEITDLSIQLAYSNAVRDQVLQDKIELRELANDGYFFNKKTNECLKEIEILRKEIETRKRSTLTWVRKRIK